MAGSQTELAGAADALTADYNTLRISNIVSL
jgi:hypothetical protein